jgi:hypothetical protein
MRKRWKAVFRGFLLLPILGLCHCSDAIKTHPVPEIYLAGYYDNGPRDVPCYWTGKLRMDLPGDGINNAYARSIFVSGGVVYTAG